MTQWYCPLPFKHAYIDNQGVSVCCRTPRQPVSLVDWHKNPELLQVQKQLLAGQKPNICYPCVDEENKRNHSLRIDSNRDYNNEIFSEHSIDFIDFRSVNICNFKCRSCFPQFSHGIAREVHEHAQLKTFFAEPPPGKTASVTEDNVDWIMQHLPQFRRIMFTGGEPTVIPGVRDLITKIKNNYPDIHVMITSNASFEDDFWFDLTRTLPNLHWTVSIDIVGARASIVRHGSDWNQIEKNVAWLAQHATSLDINSVVSNLTVFGLRPLLEFGLKMKQLSLASAGGLHGDQGCRHQFFVCQRPYWLAADNWPPELQEKLIPYLESCTVLPLDSEASGMVSSLLDQIKSANFDQNLWSRTMNYNQTLDQIRKENSSTLYEVQQ